MEEKENKVWAYRPTLAQVEQITTTLPSLGENDILIRNRAIGINPVDWKLIETNPLGWQDGHVPGVDGAGTVVAVGENVASGWIGKKVSYHAALKHNGSFAKFTVMDVKRVMLLPKGMPYSLAAALPCPMLTAWQALQKTPIREKHAVLLAGVGAVNKLLAQLLAARGVYVDAISANLSDEDAKKLKIRHVFRDRKEITSPYFAAYDAVGDNNSSLLVSHLQANGHIVSILERVPEPIDPPFTRAISYHEVALGALHDFGDDADWQQLMKDGEALMAQIQDNTLFVEQPVEFAFDDLPNALIHSKTTKQKTVVTFPLKA